MSSKQICFSGITLTKGDDGFVSIEGDYGGPQPLKRAIFDQLESLTNLVALHESAQNGTPQQDWQKRCGELGFVYTRAPDDHYVTCTEKQATELLREVLGVDVHFTDRNPWSSDIDGRREIARTNQSRAIELLNKLMDAHKFNVSRMPASNVHGVLCEVVRLLGGEPEQRVGPKCTFPSCGSLSNPCWCVPNVERANAEGGDFDCPKAAAARECQCGFCVALRTPAATSVDQSVDPRIATAFGFIAGKMALHPLDRTRLAEILK